MTKEAEIKKFYQDAIYWHLIRQGYSKLQAEIEIKKLIIREEKI